MSKIKFKLVCISLLLVGINASYSQTNIKVKSIDSLVEVINSMQLKTDSISSLAANSLSVTLANCYYDYKKTIYKISLDTKANTLDTNKLRNIVTGTVVYYYMDENVIKIEGHISFNNQLDSGIVYYYQGHFIYSTSMDNNAKGNEILKAQAMQYYNYFLKRL